MVWKSYTYYTVTLRYHNMQWHRIAAMVLLNMKDANERKGQTFGHLRVSTLVGLRNKGRAATDIPTWVVWVSMGVLRTISGSSFIIPGRGFDLGNAGYNPCYGGTT